VNGWTVAAFLVGWMVGTWMSWRKILQERRLATRTQAAITSRLSSKIVEFLQDVDVINITVTEEGEKEISIDKARLDALLDDNDPKH